MAHLQDIGTRVELVPMDAHCDQISVGLYRQLRDGIPAYRIHSYSTRASVTERLAFLGRAMCVLGGLVESEDGLLAFPCGDGHVAACRRAFLESCKLPSDAQLTPRPLTTLDKKSGLEVRVDRGESGRYTVASDGEADTKERRMFAIANGLCKLGEMVSVDDTTVHFPCGENHDALLGLLLIRAPNVRAIIREEQAVASRGVLSAPSQKAEA